MGNYRILRFGHLPLSTVTLGLKLMGSLGANRTTLIITLKSLLSNVTSCSTPARVSQGFLDIVAIATGTQTTLFPA